MGDNSANRFGVNIATARTSAGITKAALARRANISRPQIIRIEDGTSSPRLDEALRIAEILNVPLQQLVSGNPRPSSGLKGIAFELRNLGVRDFEVSGAEVPGAFRTSEEVVVLALRGDRPEPRLVEAVPFILATKKLRVRLTLAFAAKHDSRVRTRLGWLSDITLTLGQLSSFPGPVRTETALRKFAAVTKSSTPDSLGHPGEKRPSLLWRRWNITYAGDLDAFVRRARELTSAGDGE